MSELLKSTYMCRLLRDFQLYIDFNNKQNNIFCQSLSLSACLSLTPEDFRNNFGKVISYTLTLTPFILSIIYISLMIYKHKVIVSLISSEHTFIWNQPAQAPTWPASVARDLQMPFVAHCLVLAFLTDCLYPWPPWESPPAMDRTFWRGIRLPKGPMSG